MAIISMSKREFDQLEVLLRVQSGRLRVADACGLLGRSRRQVFRLLRGIREAGAASLVSKQRGKPSNRRLPAAVRQLVMSLVREHYSDFGPTFAAEKLAKRHGCTVSRETLRGWMVADGCGWTGVPACPRRTSRGAGVSAWANWFRLTGPSTPGSRAAALAARCWRLWTTRPAD